jgi:hypothetical protein
MYFLKRTMFGMALAALVSVGAGAGGVAHAQKAATEKSAEKAKSTSKTSAAKKTTARRPAAKRTTSNTAKRTTRKAAAASPCKGLSRSACGGKTTCTWVQPKKTTDVRGRKLTAYCRKAARRKTN